ncbi:conserved hypothetical protein [Paenibacillus curdlanolyticus YK9]|uniref:Uncharacterized protein n=1 Tax=Paenibacillus curdlanolyticus YK9 TaxID=717606 RepID=E0I6T1_9BACL|nr:hypothetical protein [Paenibacillus curdlanolyticus]EFM11747.1 conserved hypothetical protein [Paenibacillus curdlanolyticus YK9]
MNATIRNMSRRSRTVKTIAASLLLAALMTTAACGASNKPLSDGSVETSGTGTPDSSTDTTDNKAETNDTAGTASDNEVSGTGATETGTATPEQEPNNEEKTDSSTDEGQNAASTDQGDASVKQATGTFNGLADSHSAEITTADGTVVYQIEESITDQVSNLEEGAKIQFEYTEKALDGGQQLWLTKVAASN